MKANNFTLFAIALGLICGLRFLISFEIIDLLLRGLIFVIFLTIFIKKKVFGFFLISFTLGIGISLIDSCIDYEDGYCEIKAIVISAKNNYILVQSGLKRFYVYSKNNTYQIGDYLLIKGKVSDYVSTTYESKFDFGNYLKLKGVHKSLSLYNSEFILKMPLRIRKRENWLIGKLDSETGYILDSILFNRKNYDSRTISNASALGLTNILSTSGILFGCLLRLIENICSLRLNKQKSFQISTIFSLLVLPICLEKIGIIKIFILRILKIINKKIKFFNYIDLLSITVLLLIMFDFHNAYQTGFLLSISVSFMLYISSYLIKRNNQFVRKIFRYFLIQVFMIPIMISYSNGIHLLTPIFTVVLLPIVEIFSLFGLIGFFIYPVSFILNFIGNFIDKMFILLSGTDLFIRVPFSNIFSYSFYIIFFICLLIHEIGDIKARDLIVLFYVGLCAISCVPIIPFITKEVTFINVGQGDCCIIREGSKTIMIDTGGNTSFDMATEVLIPYLYKRRIYKIDYLIGTHGDYDHIGAKDSLIDNFLVKKYLDSSDDFPLTIGSITLTNYNNYGLEEENESSLVLGCYFMGKEWLFMGDAPVAVEAMILEDYPSINCDILKIGHHGSSTSSSLSFLEKVSPETAVISVGANNSYGHPTNEVIERLHSLNIEIRRTDIEGTISYIKPFYS